MKANGHVKPGDACGMKGCVGRLRVYMSRLNFARNVRVRYLHCPVCGHLPAENKWVVPMEFAPPKVRNT